MTNKNNAVDFNNPEALAAELAAADEAATAAKTTEKKERKPRTIKVSFTADHDIKTGETVEFDYTLPVSQSTRGQVAGIPLTEMTDDQLKIEHRNANSIYYKQNKAGKLTEKATERLAAVKAEMEKRGIKPSSRGTATVDASTVAELIKSGKISVEDIQKMLDASAQ